MSGAEWLYRARQFWSALRAAPSPRELEQVRRWLTPPQMALFEQMPPAEQAHSLRVIRRLAPRLSEIPEPVRQDFIAAALLHDVGKNCAPLRLWERVVIVLVEMVSPSAFHRWGSGPARGWRRPFVVARMHPAWGADLVARAGASPLTVELIRRHQNFRGENSVYVADDLLSLLQAADGNS